MNDDMKFPNEEVSVHWSHFDVGIVVLAALGAGSFIAFRFMWR